jgi:FkbM family methyltransferase
MFWNFEEYLDLNQRNLIFIDVGANKGLWLDEAVNKYPDCVVHAFEPIKGITPTYDNVVINNCCIDIVQSKNRVFYITKDNVTSSLLKLNDGIINSFGNYTDPKGILHKKSDFDLHDTISVDTIRLDTYIEDKSINDIHYLKIDAEGNDLNVFKSLGIYKSIVWGCELEVWNEENTLFNDANWLDEVLNYMSLENFELVDRFVHGKGFSSDLLFINRNFLK